MRGVLATACDTAIMDGLVKVLSITLLTLDVMVQISVAAATMRAQTGGSLDYLVSKSGSEYVISLLDLDVEKAKAKFVINVWESILIT